MHSKEKKRKNNLFILFVFLILFSFIVFFILKNKSVLNKTELIYPKGSKTGNGLTKQDEKIYNFGIENNSEAKYIKYLPSKNKSTGIAVIICPGGGYKFLSYKNEGISVAKWLIDNGIAAFVLFYRMPNKKYHNIPLEDSQEMIKIIRKNADKWNIDPQKIGIMGFSAGGHLAACASNIYKKETRPDFTILYYPVITMDVNYTNSPSMYNLLGDDEYKLKDFYSAEKRVNKKTPPAYIVYSKDDLVVNPINSKMYYEALKKNKIQVKITEYDQGDHGWGWSKKFKYSKENKENLLMWITALF